MTKLLAAASLCLAFSTCSAASVYPTTYPFSKESQTPPSLPVTKPYDNKDFASASNPGGYLARQFTCDPYSNDRLSYTTEYTASVPTEYLPDKPAGFRECRAQALQQWTAKSNMGMTQTHNCTYYTVYVGRGQVSEASLWTISEVDGEKICEAGKCCTIMDGLYMVNGKRSLSYPTGAGATLKKSGSCTKFPPEEVWCPEAAHATVCQEYFPKGKNNARIKTLACYDNMWLYLMSCPVYKATTTALLEISSTLSKWETPSYIKLLTASQINVAYSGVSNPDRVCNPYSYYYPSSAKKDVDTTASTTPSTGLVAGASMFTLCMALFAAIM